MGLPAEAYITPEDYLRAERHAETKHEYYDGEIFAMAGAGRRHNLITFNLAGVFHRQLRGKPCEAYAGDMRVKITESGLYTYPDVVIVRDKPEFDDAQKDTLTNPGIIIEVLSDSTEAYDRGKKFEHYRQLPSLTDYILVAQYEAHIEHYSRLNAGWLLHEAKGLEERIHIADPVCELHLAEVYEKVDFSPASELSGFQVCG